MKTKLDNVVKKRISKKKKKSVSGRFYKGGSKNKRQARGFFVCLFGSYLEKGVDKTHLALDHSDLVDELCNINGVHFLQSLVDLFFHAKLKS